MPERLTDAQIDELLAMEAKATPGDWQQSHRRDESDGMYYTQVYDASGDAIATLHWHVIDPLSDHMKTDRAENSEFIAASRNSIRSLLAEVRERRAVEKSCTKPVTPNDHLDLIYETAIARAEKEGKNR